MAHIDTAGAVHINVQYNKHEKTIQHVDVKSSRLLVASQLLAGKPVTAVSSLMPLVFAICSHAQTIAALTAIETAHKLKVCEQVKLLRNVLLLSETARELALRLQRHWFANSSLVDLKGLLKWSNEIKHKYLWVLSIAPQVPAGFDAESTQPLVESHTRSLKKCLSDTGINFDEPVTLDAIKHSALWMPLSALNESVIGVELGAQPALLSEEEDLLALLAKRTDFSQLPSGEQGTLENSVWTRNCQHPVVKDALSDGMHPITLRVLGMLVELLNIPNQLQSIESVMLTKPLGTNAALVDAARGRLLHHVTFKNDAFKDLVVDQYHIVAPTEWNFHPQGVVKQLLQGVHVEKELLQNIVEKVVLAVDPCLEFTINITDV